MRSFVKLARQGVVAIMVQVLALVSVPSAGANRGSEPFVELSGLTDFLIEQLVAVAVPAPQGEVAAPGKTQDRLPARKGGIGQTAAAAGGPAPQAVFVCQDLARDNACAFVEARGAAPAVLK